LILKTIVYGNKTMKLPEMASLNNQRIQGVVCIFLMVASIDNSNLFLKPDFCSSYQILAFANSLSASG
jgi:hypothetical protein